MWAGVGGEAAAAALKPSRHIHCGSVPVKGIAAAAAKANCCLIQIKFEIYWELQEAQQLLTAHDNEAFVAAPIDASAGAALSLCDSPIV